MTVMSPWTGPGRWASNPARLIPMCVEGDGVELLGDLLQMRAAAGGSMPRLLARLVTEL